MTWTKEPEQTWCSAAASFMVMWMAMMAAMMLPCLTPMLLIYRRSIDKSSGLGRTGLTAIVGTAYFVVWGLVGAIAYPMGAALAEAETRWSPLARAVPVVSGVILLLAGAVQFTKWKACQLRCCREARVYQHGGESEAVRAWKHGMRLGWRCCLCCSGPTAILFAVGVMDLTAMGIVAVAMAIERVIPHPALVARVTGAVAIAAGVFDIVRCSMASG